ncbi:hypothetical protein LOTGIDRAFT_232101 [Lottia gigantea]|uniref:Uncharacterized protein n=1 Tax=Lottia gigantea TaxID=225164 RepID=V4AL47_LOTGI|nr:hypothetical protein LOTGIDRAFT_232101 [Lottia gigantea]ESO95470.1 hypothetical protein LOTGIDRAFT_232101 [Lottia gigantea]
MVSCLCSENCLSHYAYTLNGLARLNKPSKMYVCMFTQSKRRSYSEYNSVWHFKEILKFLNSPDASDEPDSRTTSLDFLRSCNYTVDSTAPTMQPEEDELMNNFASDIVKSVVNKVKNDYYSGHYEGDMHNRERRDSDELELTFPENDGRRRSVRFHNDEHIIPNLLSGSTLTPGSSNALKPVSEHVLTPVPSPIPPELLHRDSITEEPAKGVTLVETLLLRLLDDLNNQRLSRPDLETLTSYCLQVLRTHDLTSKIEEFQEQHELKRTTSSEVASELVQFTLDKMLDDVKSGSVNDNDLTTITLALVRQRNQISPNMCLENDIRDHILETLEKIGSEEGGIKDYVTKSLNKIDSEARLDCFVAAVLSQAVADIKSGVIDSEGLKLIGSNVIAHSQSRPVVALSESEMKSSVEEVLQKIDITDLKENNTIYAIISSYYTVNQQNREIVKDFVVEVFPKICATMKAPDSDRIKKNIKEFRKELKGESVSDMDINKLGLQIMYVGKKCLPPTIQETCKGYKELIKNVKQVLDRNEFKKEVDRVLCEYFIRDKMQRSGESPGYSTIYNPSPESKVAINVVLGTMDRIIRDVYTHHIPPELLTALASEIYALAQKYDSIFDPSEEPSIKPGMPVLNRIYEKFRENQIGFKDAKWMFATIFHTYCDPDSVIVSTEFKDICPNDRALIGNLVDETINKIVQTVAMEIKEELDGDNISVVEIEDLVREELHGLNEGRERPAELSHVEGDLENILQGCLSKAARDIARHVEGVESDISVESRTKLSDMSFMGKVVDFISSALDHLTQNIKSGDIKSSTVLEFLNRVSGSDVKQLAPIQHQELLEEIRLNIERKREESEYFSNLASLFSEITLDPKSTTSGLRAISKILSSIDSEVLMEFVQAAMLCVLSYIQSDRSASKDVPITNETSFHRIESLLLVRKVLNYVVDNVSHIVKANDAKKSGSKSIFKRFSSKKLDNKDSRSLYECIISAFEDANDNLSQERSNILTPNVLATTDEKVLEHILDVTDLIQRRCDGKEPKTVMSDEFEIICEMMINSINDMERSLERPKDLILAFGSSMIEFDEENIQHYVLGAIKDALFYFNPNMAHSVASNSSRDTVLLRETSGTSNASDSTRGTTASVSKVPSQAIEIMVKSVLSSVVADQKSQLEVPESGIRKPSLTDAEGKTSKTDYEKDPSITTLKPILGSHPLDIGEDDISSALSYITMKPRATHHNPPEHEARQSYRSLVCPDVHNYSQTKHAITEMIGSERAGSGAVVTLMEESESEDSSDSSYSAESCRVLEITGHDGLSSTEVVFDGNGENLNSSENKTKSSTEVMSKASNQSIKTSSNPVPKSNLSLRRGASLESESNRSRESVKKQSSLGVSPSATLKQSTSTKKPETQTLAKSSSIASNKHKSSDIVAQHRDSKTCNVALKSSKEATSKSSSSSLKSKNSISASVDQSKNNNGPSIVGASSKQLTETHPPVNDSTSVESQRSSQNDVMAIASLCGSHKSSIVVRETDESMKEQI